MTMKTETKRDAPGSKFLREQLAHAKNETSTIAYKFSRACERSDSSPSALGDIAQDMILAAAEVRMAAHAVVLATKGRKAVRS